MAKLKIRKPKLNPEGIWHNRIGDMVSFYTVDVIKKKVDTTSGQGVKVLIKVLGDVAVPGQGVLAHIGWVKSENVQTSLVHDLYLWGDGYYVRGIDEYGMEWQGSDKSCVLFPVEVEVTEERLASLKWEKEEPQEEQV